MMTAIIKLVSAEVRQRHSSLNSVESQFQARTAVTKRLCRHVRGTTQSPFIDERSDNAEMLVMGATVRVAKQSVLNF